MKPRIKTRLGRKYKEALFAENVRHKALFGGRGGGKSWATATYLLLKAAESRKHIVCARQFQNSIRDSSKFECRPRRVLLDRGWGKPKQPMEGGSMLRAPRITIEFVDSTDDEPGLTIDHADTLRIEPPE